MFTVVSYYTIDYLEDITKLVGSLNRFNIDYQVDSIEDRGDWYENTKYKAEFIRKKLGKYPRLVFIDADGVVQKYPELFDTIECDVAGTFRRENNGEFLSGTLFFQNTDKAFEVIDKWMELNIANKNMKLEQFNLYEAIQKTEGINFYKLPQTYTKIFDLMKDVGDPVIEHFQASRRFWKRKNGK